MKSTLPPLLVDLDGSLIKTDTLIESILSFIKRTPWSFPLIFIWLYKGKDTLKKEVYLRSDIDVSLLPLRPEVVEYMRCQKELGRKIVLITGAWQSLAEKFKQIVPEIDEVVGTTEGMNLTGSNKANLAIDRWGNAGFDYIGNESRDIAVWKASLNAIVVGDERLVEEAKKSANVSLHLVQTNPGLKVWLKQLRIHQWTKNALLFVPILTSHQILHIGQLSTVFLAFLIFSICASGTYIINDLFDLDADRKHSEKKYRPLADGKISLISAVTVASLLIGSGVVVSALILGMVFTASLLAYMAITLLYSLRLKRLQTIDVITLASLFTIRIIAGGAAASIYISFWLMSFSMFAFLSLALVKRVSELMHVSEFEVANDQKVGGRGYYTSDILILQTLGSISGFMSILVFALYLNSDDVTAVYATPEILWAIIPLYGYWVMRIWMLTARDEMEEDPIKFAITDKNSWLAAFLMLLTILLASLVG